MNANTDTGHLGGAHHPPKQKKYYWQRMGGKFLVISIALHLLFITAATYYVVQTFSTKKLTFQGGAPTNSPSKKSLEHKVNMAQKQKSMSAPAPMKRVVTTAATKISLPEMPAMPAVTSNVPVSMGGMGGTGAFGNGMGNGRGNGGGGGGVFSPYGLREAKPSVLTGRFYDLKHTSGRQDTKDLKYKEEIKKFVKDGWHEGSLNKYLKGTRPLYATSIFFPTIDTSEAPKAFGSPIEDDAGAKWIAIYKGSVSPPESGTYYFVAAGDDNMIIRFDGKLVLDHCEHWEGDVQPTDEYRYSGERNKFAKSLPITVEKGKFYEIMILIGDDTPRSTDAKILIEKEGTNYEKDSSGSPILPIFALDKVTVSGTVTPAHLDNGPIWTGKNAQRSIMDPP